MNIDPSKLAAAKNALQHFFPLAKELELQSYGSGHIHLTFLAQLANGQQYILQQINTTVFKNPFAISQNIDHLYRHLKKGNYPYDVARPIALPEGDFVYVDQNEDYWRVFSFLYPTCSFDQAQNPQQAYSAAKAFGVFLQNLINLDPSLIKDGIPNFHNCQYRQVQFQTAIREDPRHRLQHIREEVAFLKAHNYCHQWQSKQLPRRLSHNDTKINNILYRPDGQTPAAIIDLDTVMLTSPLYDFGDMVRTFTNAAYEDAPAKEVDMQMPIFKSLCLGFAESTQDLLIPAEREALLLAAFLMVHVQAQRFFCDYLNGDTYYHIQYPDHNLVRGNNQLALLKSMLAQKKEMQQIIEESFP